MTVPMEDERWTRMVHQHPHATAAPAADLRTDTAPDIGQLAQAVERIAADVKVLTEEIRLVSNINENRFAEIRGVVAAQINNTAAVADAASELRGVAARLSGQMSEVVAEMHRVSDQSRVLREQTTERFQAVEERSVASLERFRESISALSSELGDTLIQVATRLKAAEELGRTISVASTVLDTPVEFDRMAKQLDWLVDILSRLQQRSAAT